MMLGLGQSKSVNRSKSKIHENLKQNLNVKFSKLHLTDTDMIKSDRDLCKLIKHN